MRAALLLYSGVGEAGGLVDVDVPSGRDGVERGDHDPLRDAHDACALGRLCAGAESSKSRFLTYAMVGELLPLSSVSPPALKRGVPGISFRPRPVSSNISLSFDVLTFPCISIAIFFFLLVWCSCVAL